MLASLFKHEIPHYEFKPLQTETYPPNEYTYARELPTLLHCAAKFGLKNLALQLLQCSGATWAARMKNMDGSDMLHLAERHGHVELKKILEDVMVSLSLSLYICSFFYMCTHNIDMNLLWF